MSENPEEKEIPYEKIEPIILEILKSDEFLPDTVGKLLKYFRNLDKDNNNYLNIEVLKDMIMSLRIMDEKEFNNFSSFAGCKNGNEYNLFYYEDYILKLASIYDKHTKNLYDLKRFN